MSSSLLLFIESCIYTQREEKGTVFYTGSQIHDARLTWELQLVNESLVL